MENTPTPLSSLPAKAAGFTMVELMIVVAIVALSQFGVVWLFLAAPVVVIIRDLFRYAYGRLSEPPRPAGLLPGEPLPVSQPVTSIPARRASRRRNRRSAEGHRPSTTPMS